MRNRSLSFAVEDIVHCGNALFFHRASRPGGQILLRSRGSCCLSSTLCLAHHALDWRPTLVSFKCIWFRLDGLDLEAFGNRLLHMCKFEIVVYLVSVIFIIWLYFRNLFRSRSWLHWGFRRSCGMLLINLYVEVHVGEVRALNQDLISLVKCLHHRWW